jgi:hypothetical protein
LSARARLLDTGGDRETDPADTLRIAQVALFRQDLRKITPEGRSTILRLLTERHNDLVNERTRTANRLHAVLLDLLPDRVPTGLPAGTLSGHKYPVSLGLWTLRRPVQPTNTAPHRIDPAPATRRRPKSNGPNNRRVRVPPVRLPHRQTRIRHKRSVVVAS